MSTKKKSDAIQFLESLVGELTFGGLIEAMRQAEEMSQVDFAKKLGISKQHLCDIEKGRKFVSPERAAKFAKDTGPFGKELCSACAPGHRQSGWAKAKSHRRGCMKCFEGFTSIDFKES